MGADGKNVYLVKLGPKNHQKKNQKSFGDGRTTVAMIKHLILGQVAGY